MTDTCPHRAAGFQLHAQASTFWAESPPANWCPQGKGTDHLPSAACSPLPGMALEFCKERWLDFAGFNDMAHCQPLLNLLLELSSV